MYKDILSYELAEGVTQKQLLSVAEEIIVGWMSKQKGFVCWEIHTNDKGGFTDIVYWEDEASAKNAEKDMCNIPNANAWYSCYKEGSITSKHLNKIL